MADLYAERGGTEICIPIECGDDHWMVRLFGEEKAEQVCAHFRAINADGDYVGGIRAYIPMINSRMAALQDQIAEEVKQALIDGKSAGDICRTVGISERKVRDHIKFLRDTGVIPQPPAPTVKKKHALAAHREAQRNLRRSKTEKVDELVLAGRSTRYIIAAVGISATLIRGRRRHFLETGALCSGYHRTSEIYNPAGRLNAADHSAKVGEMIDVQPDEVDL